MAKINNTIAQKSASIRDECLRIGAGCLYLDNLYSQAPDLRNSIDRALSLMRNLGNVVFISEPKEQGEKLAATALAQLNNDVPRQQAVQLDMGILIDTKKGRAGVDFKNIIHLLSEAKGRVGLILINLEKVVEDSHVVSTLLEAIEKRSLPVIGLTDMNGFRKLEEWPSISGFLQFILTDKERSQTRRDKSVLIVGATSLLGKAVYRLFKSEYAFVRGTGFNKAASSGFDRLDVTSEDEIKKYFSEHPDFDIVIYVAGEANADTAEKEMGRARMLNTDALSSISRYVKDSKFVYISTEYVFDGNTGPYGSGSKADPINYYGRTKLEGEGVSLKDFSNALILRLGALYGYNGSDDKETSVGRIIASLDKAEPLKADNVQIKHPILLEDAAMTLLKLLDYEASGIYQTNGPEGLNKQEMAIRIAKVRNEVTGCVFSYPIVGITQGNAAGKPLNTHMVNVDTPRPFNEGIRFLLLKQRAFKDKDSHGH